ncbi:hypothetical protein F511_14085 [Dorcoceras hygrometricum]|uniref:Uncharacterized protein n=1 Tax=Dorcoceras hygrometricum TaxID=472368 RepID=A0A2Z7BU26_9LAMI|nr:hypothetical protein F511_14085 [Dorcoceras hygrometricum]
MMSGLLKVKYISDLIIPRYNVTSMAVPTPSLSNFIEALIGWQPANIFHTERFQKLFCVLSLIDENSIIKLIHLQSKEKCLEVLMFQDLM